MQLLAFLSLVSLGLSGAGATLEETFNQALIAEEGHRDYDAARRSYEEVLRQLDSQRRLAATAVFRLGEVYRKLGRTNDAIAQYQRVLRQFADESTLVQLSQQNLVALGSRVTTTSGDPGALLAASPATGAGESEAGEAAVGATDEEDQEIRRISALIRQSPDLINAVAEGGSAPLHLAAAKGHLAVIRHLLASGAKVDVPDQLGESPLQKAVRAGHLAAAEALLDAGANVQGTAGATPLHSAVSRGYERIRDLLLARGAEINAVRMTYITAKSGPEKDRLVGINTTPLGVAVHRDRRDAVEFLLDRGADPNACDGPECALPINLSISREMTELLLQRGARAALAAPQLRAAIVARDLDIVALLLEAGCDPNTLNPQGITDPLFDLPGGTTRYRPVPVRVGRAETTIETNPVPGDPSSAPETPPRDRRMAELLLQHGLDVHRLLPIIATSLDAGWLGWALEHGADPNSRDDQGRTLLELTGIGAPPLPRQRLADISDKVRRLLARGADPNQKFTDGQYPVHALCRHLTPEWLGDAQVDVNVVDAVGSTPLMWAVAARNAAAVDWLLARGADVHARDPHGATALHYAAAVRTLPSIVQKLLAAKADKDVKLAGYGHTPADLLRHPPVVDGLWPRWGTANGSPPSPTLELEELRTLLPSDASRSGPVLVPAR